MKVPDEEKYSSVRIHNNGNIEMSIGWARITDNITDMWEYECKIFQECDPRHKFYIRKSNTMTPCYENGDCSITFFRPV